MKQGSLSPNGCLIHGGRVTERATYVWHAEVAVAAYLELPAPAEKDHEEAVQGVPERTKEYLLSPFDAIEHYKATTNREPPIGTIVPAVHEHGENFELLDTLPDRFECEPKMMYSHFARYEYNEVRSAEGKNQTAKLRQLADLFDNTGKTLFYYYAVPRLCKQMYPPTDGETVTGQAAEVWRTLSGVEKEKWCNASAELKKKLRDGDIGGLEVLELGSLDPEVLWLHQLAALALQAHGSRG